jgi:hypothetical protein
MSHIIQHNPGQTVTVTLQILNSLGARTDGYDGYDGYIDFIIFPNLILAAGYPSAMTRIDTGLYVHYIVLPPGAAAVGTYIVGTAWKDPDTGLKKQDIYQIVVTAPFGQYSVAPG